MTRWEYAFSLRANEVQNSEPPGTVRLIEHQVHQTISGSDGVQSDVIQLVPAPSQSHYDPLNWSSTRRCAILATMAFMAFSVDFATGCVAPALPVLAFQFSVLMFGISNILWVPLSNIVGRRPVLLGSMLIFTLGSVWCGLATSFESLLAARAIQGFAGAVYTVSPVVVGDVFFVHERGRAIAIYTGCLAVGPYVAGIAGGYIAGRHGYRYLFWISTALGATCFLLEFFLVPETLFNRTKEMQPESTIGASSLPPEEGKSQVIAIEASDSSHLQTKISYMHTLHYRKYDGRWIHHFISPYKSLLLPGTWMLLFQYGALVGGVVALVTTAPSLVAAPPYLWGNNVGLVNLGGLIGVAVGTLLLYSTADYVVKWRAKKERSGFSEPETRLPIIFPGIIIAFIGLLVFGLCAANPSPTAWAGLAVGLGLHAIALTMVPSIGFNYVIEAYGERSADCFAMVAIARAVVAFAWTYFIFAWVESAGPAEPFGIFAMITAVVGLLVIPLYFYGKRSRIALASFISGGSEDI